MVTESGAFVWTIVLDFAQIHLLTLKLLVPNLKTGLRDYFLIWNHITRIVRVQFAVYVV